MRIISYDRISAINYAREWALSRNPRWYDFSDIGGDCTNFISQCIYAGSGTMNHPGWFYRSLSSRSPSWTGVEFLWDFLIHNRTLGPFGFETDANDVIPGDIVQLGDGSDYYHTLFITSIDPILVCAHTFDALDRPLSTYSYANARYFHISGVRVP